MTVMEYKPPIRTIYLQDVRDFLQLARKKGVKKLIIKDNGRLGFMFKIKIKAAGEKFLYYYQCDDSVKAQKLEEAMPPTILKEKVGTKRYKAAVQDRGQMERFLKTATKRPRKNRPFLKGMAWLENPIENGGI